MGLLGGNLWDDVIDIRDKHKKKQSDPISPKGSGPSQSPVENDKKNVSGLTIFYRVLGTIVLIATMIKSWITSPSLFDWALIAVSLLLIGVHRRLGAEAVVDRLRPAFLNLHERLQAVESKIDPAEKADQKEK
jgi:hypothetical protein